MGLKRYVLDSPQPFIVKVNYGGDHFRGQRIDQPLSTITRQHGAALVTPYLAQTGYGEREGQTPRTMPVTDPLGTIVGDGKHALVSAFISKFYGGVVGHSVDRPIGAITAVDSHGLATACMIRMNHGDKQWNSVEEPLVTVTSQGNKSGLACAYLSKFRGTGVGSAVDEPAATITGGGTHAGLVYAFLTKYFGTAVGQDLIEPLHTITGRDRFGLVTVMVGGEPYAIVDIGLRMLSPRELARCQGFPDSYVLPTVKSHAVRLIGNSVSPPVATALVAANMTSGRATRACA